jgi:formylglycine-generating enzyme required for sulfatase activity
MLITGSRRLEHPVVMVDWQDAITYVAWLADCTG